MGISKLVYPGSTPGSHLLPACYAKTLVCIISSLTLFAAERKPSVWARRESWCLSIVLCGVQYGVHLVICQIKYCGQDNSYNWCYASQHFTVPLAVRFIISLDPCTVTSLSYGYESQDVSSKGNSGFPLDEHRYQTEQQVGLTAHWNIQR